MGREIKRVPTDFEWPLGKIYSEECEEPPTGDGWQLWENVSEGSPVSPVFATKEEFADYLVEQGHNKKAVQNFIEMGWCCSMVMVDGRFYSNIDGCEF